MGYECKKNRRNAGEYMCKVLKWNDDDNDVIEQNTRVRASMRCNNTL